MKISKAYMDIFVKKYNETYSFLYKHRDNVVGFDEAVDAFDKEACDKYSDLVKAFVEYRMDFISSDREAAAFMMTLYSLAGGF